MVVLPVTLATAAGCALLNIWLGWRIVRLRVQFKVNVGDGGHEPLVRRMRAQANFIENAPFVLILLGALELSGASRLALSAIAALFLLARISHGVGMDGGDLGRWRAYGMSATTIVNAALIVWGLIVAGSVLLGS